MTRRERMLAGSVLGVLTLVGAVFLFHQLFVVPYRARGQAIDNAREQIENKVAQLRQAAAERDRLERYRQLSLPPDAERARLEYLRYLADLLRDAGFEPGSYTVSGKEPDTHTVARGKKPPFTTLDFTVIGHGNLGSLVKLMEGFYRTGLLHRIKSFSIRRPLTTGQQQAPNTLDVTLSIEAVSVAGVPPRPQLLPNLDPRYLTLETAFGLRRGPVGLALAAWAAGPTGPRGPGLLAEQPRRYDDVASHNIFFGPPQKDRRSDEWGQPSGFVYLTDITQNTKGFEAFLYNRYNNTRTRLRSSPGFNKFRITDEGGEASVQGEVVRIAERDLWFQAGGKYYRLHVGQSIADAMEKAVSPGEAGASGKIAAEAGAASETTKPVSDERRPNREGRRRGRRPGDER